uniref:Clc-like protein n=1 Tax=Caenorhabditis tropicalis TaxID=1561998 RepID=A0A1I7UVD4_9PELO
MIDASSSPAQCSRKTALAIHFTLSLIAFLLCLLGLISPSWQLVNLENGRTEHHHGLWLDCKRDYSFDYGRTREYYETLYRRDMQGSPFAEFFLPRLQCVYKFDYYIDQEDLYDHNHDENRIQNDAYQHTFLGWKIAVLSGVGSGVVCAGVAVLIATCAFCHRNCFTVSLTLLFLAMGLSLAGDLIFYLFATTQDNKVIKEEEENETYEQILGWAFHCHLLGSLLLLFCNILGCCVCSINPTKGRSELVSIELVENGDGSELLSNNFKRSFSAVYRVDSSALRQWEKSYLKNAMEKGEQNFKRTASVPNFSKNHRKSKRAQRSGQDFFSSTSNITEVSHFGSNITMNTQVTKDTTQTAPAAVACPVPPGKPLKSALKTPIQGRRELEPPNTYEYCESTIGVSSFLGSRTPTRPNHPYDEVYETIPGEDYLEPKSARNNRLSTSTLSTTDMEHNKMLQKTLPPVHGSSQSIPVKKSTVIDDVAPRPSSFNEDPRDINLFRIRERTRIEKEEREKFIKTAMLPPPVLPVKPKSLRDIGIDLSKESVGTCKIEEKAMLPPRIPENKGSFAKHNPGYDDSDDFPPPPSEIGLNTFATKQKSITNLSFRGISAAQQIFDRPESLISVSSSASNNKNDKRNPLTNLSQHSLINRRLLNVMPDEVDRSVGSSTVLENEVQDSPNSYAQDAEVRLNLFMKDKNNQDETTV